MQDLPTPKSISEMGDANKAAADEQEKDRKLILELGRFFEKAVDDFIKAHGDVKGTVVNGAANYIINLYKERMVTLMEHQSLMYGALKERINVEGLKVHEPFSNDNLEGHAWQNPTPPGPNGPGVQILKPGGAR